jgi:hypothetical protein
MKSLGCILWGLAIASLILTAIKSSLIWVAAPLLALALSCSLSCAFLYRPPENHLGVIYQFGRLWRLVGPDEWIGVIPWVNEIKPPISLHLRRVEVALSDVLTQDRLPINCDLIAYYQLDLRQARIDFRFQALRIPDEGWNSIITTVLREAANKVVGGIDLQQLLTPGGHGLLKGELSALLAERVQSLGLIVNPHRGVSVQAVKPTDAVCRAAVDRFVAALLGEAALDRVRPILGELGRDHPDVARGALLLEWAAAVVQQGKSPGVLVTPDGWFQSKAMPDQLATLLEGLLPDTGTERPTSTPEMASVWNRQDHAE